MDALVLPPSLTHIFFGANFNQSINQLPPKIKSIHLPASLQPPFLPPLFIFLPLSPSPFLLPLPLSLSPNANVLSVLRLGHDFNQSVDALPATIVDLTLGESFSQKLNNLPHRLFRLDISRYSLCFPTLFPFFYSLYLITFLRCSNHSIYSLCCSSPLLYPPLPFLSLPHLSLSSFPFPLSPLLPLPSPSPSPFFLLYFRCTQYYHELDHLPENLASLKLPEKFYRVWKGGGGEGGEGREREGREGEGRGEGGGRREEE